MSQNPRAFISHSREDNDRFVIRFAERLRQKGVDAWADFWEMLPGDSLVDKIFSEGLKNCQVFIVILSNSSIRSKWVREELNTGMVKKIEDNTKLIPIRLDACEVPEALRNTIWIDISDPANYDREFERIVNSIFGQYQTPPLGPVPGHVRSIALNIVGLTKIDSIIFECACKMAIEQGYSLIEATQLVSALRRQDISESQILETQQILEGRGYIKPFRVVGPEHVYDFAISDYGFNQFAQVGIENYPGLCANVARMLVRQEETEKTSIAQRLNQPVLVIHHIFVALESKNLITCLGHRSVDGQMFVHWVSPELRRMLEAQN